MVLIYATSTCDVINEPPHGKTNNLHRQKQRRRSVQISRSNCEADHAFVFATQIVQPLFYLKPKFQASSLLLRLYRPVCVGPGWNPNCWFSHAQAQITAFSVQQTNTAKSSICVETIKILYMKYTYEPHREKTRFLPRRKQRRRSASR